MHSEYKTYLNNKNIEGFKPASVNDNRVFQFLEDIYGLQSGNPIEAFEISDDIIKYLKEQWAGLFQRLLQESSRQKEINIIENLKSTASTLNHLVTFLTEERSKGDEAIKDILLSSHPAFAAIKAAAKIPYRVVFHSFKELDELLTARSFSYDDNKAEYGIRVNTNLFDKDGKLKIITPEEWDESWVSTYPIKKKSDIPDFDDDIPF